MDDVRPPNKVTDYSSSSEESDTTDEDDDEEVDQEAGEESTSGPEDSRAVYVPPAVTVRGEPLLQRQEVFVLTGSSALLQLLQAQQRRDRVGENHDCSR